MIFRKLTERLILVLGSQYSLLWVLIIISIITLNPTKSLAQDGLDSVNYLDCSELGDFTFNEISIREFNSTNGDSNQINTLVGNIDSIQFLKEVEIGVFTYGESKIHFDYEFNFTREISLRNESDNFGMGDSKVFISDSLSILEYFYSDKLIPYTRTDSLSEYRLKCIGYGDDVSIYVNNDSVITKIKYWIGSIFGKEY